MKPYNKSIKDVLNDLKTEANQGLNQQEATQRLERDGKNVLKGKKSKSFFIKFLEQFKDAMVIILLIAAVISFGIAIYEKIDHQGAGGEGAGFAEPLAILGIVVFNALLGAFQESKAEKALEALKKMSAAHAKVLRGGEVQSVSVEDLVVGDIIMLEAGDIVPADARLLETSSFKVDESSLTGESLPVEKDADVLVPEDKGVGDRVNMVFSGSPVNYGSAKAVITATGMNTEIGKIATLLENEEDTQTPLQVKLGVLGKQLGYIALFICAIIFVIGVTTSTEPNMLDRIIDTFMIAISLAVAAIPEGLPIVVTIILSLGVQRMAKRRAIVRKLPAVETLGSISVICSDKTGTLTQNKMTVTDIYVKGMPLETKNKLNDENMDKARDLLLYGLLCCDAVVNEENGELVHIGDPTESSIVAVAHINGIIQKEANEKYKRLASIPFDSTRKLMTTINEINGKKYIIVKGAFDVIEKRCISGDTEGAIIANEQMAKNALRVLGLAIKEIDEVPSKLVPEEIEKDLTFVGLFGMIDPPREEVKDSIRKCANAGIKPIMITGDHILTATAIARELGIYKEDDIAITGESLRKLTDDELKEKLGKITVYARVAPEDKIRIVKMWQEMGKIVAMTGDGVNDAPALKAADIGCAMGITGTEVSKSAADMTLTDDNFATIVDAVEEGRTIFDNIKKTIQLLLSGNIGEIISVFLAMCIWQFSPFTALQLLWINLVTDSLPGIALSVEKPEKDIMFKKPRPKDEKIFAGGLGLNVLLNGLYTGVIIVGVYALGYYFGPINHEVNSLGAQKVASTMAFISLSMLELFHSFNVRSHKSIFKTNIFENRALINAFIASSLLLVVAVFVPPLAELLELTKLTWKEHLISLAAAFSIIILVEIEKLIKKLVNNKKKVAK